PRRREDDPVGAGAAEPALERALGPGTPDRDDDEHGDGPAHGDDGPARGVAPRRARDRNRSERDGSPMASKVEGTGMEKVETLFVDRTGWPAGPWDTEPDREDFEHVGLACLALRHPEYGNWCGYVGVSATHPLYGVGMTDATPALGDAYRARLA